MAARITHAHENVDPGGREGVAHPERRQIEVVVDRGHGGDRTKRVPVGARGVAKTHPHSPALTRTRSQNAVGCCELGPHR